MLCRRLVIANPSLRFRCLVRREIVRPTETDWLVPEFHLHVERPRGIAGFDHIPGERAFIVEVGVGGGLANNRNVWLSRFLVETPEQAAAVFQVSDRR